jgi:ABC-2 type transport system permease protein
MLGRNLLHAKRYPGLTASVIATPVVLLLLFVYVLGGTLEAGLGASAGGGSYVDYLLPGVLLVAIASGSIGAAVSVNTDTTGGIVNRFRTMPIARSSLLTGHVLGNVITTVLGSVFVIIAAVLVGARPNASVVEWLAVFGFVAAATYAVTWVSVAMGVAAKTPESASNAALPVMLLPFLGSTFVPTDSMPTGLRWFAENQPFTPVVETLRGLLLGTPIGSSATVALGWCVLLTLVGYVAARRRFNRPGAR